MINFLFPAIQLLSSVKVAGLPLRYVDYHQATTIEAMAVSVSRWINSSVKTNSGTRLKSVYLT